MPDTTHCPRCGESASDDLRYSLVAQADNLGDGPVTEAVFVGGTHRRVALFSGVGVLRDCAGEAAFSVGHKLSLEYLTQACNSSSLLDMETVRFIHKANPTTVLTVAVRKATDTAITGNRLPLDRYGHIGGTWMRDEITVLEGA